MLHIGTSGYSYDDWKGCWYPPDLPRNRMFDYYARRFDTVEINSTFYRIPPPRMMESLVRRSGGQMIFAAKMSRLVTHDGDLSAQAARAYNAAMAPAMESGQLRAILLQFPFTFTFTDDNRRYLEKMMRLFAHFPLVVEIRHASWRSPDAWRFFADGGINLCITDMPQLEGYPVNSPRLTGQIAYVRFHGRDTKWFAERRSFAPYDYLYELPELEAWVEPIRQLEKQAGLALVYFNNHAFGQAPTNAGQMMQLLGRKTGEPAYTDMFADQFIREH